MRNVWCDGHLWNEVNVALYRNNNVAEIVFSLLQEFMQVNGEQFVTILWSIWKSRSMRVWSFKKIFLLQNYLNLLIFIFFLI